MTGFLAEIRQNAWHHHKIEGEKWGISEIIVIVHKGV
jgi:hypothetical protein